MPINSFEYGTGSSHATFFTVNSLYIAKSSSAYKNLEVLNFINKLHVTIVSKILTFLCNYLYILIITLIWDTNLC